MSKPIEEKCGGLEFVGGGEAAGNGRRALPWRLKSFGLGGSLKT